MSRTLPAAAGMGVVAALLAGPQAAQAAPVAIVNPPSGSYLTAASLVMTSSTTAFLAGVATPAALLVPGGPCLASYDASGAVAPAAVGKSPPIEYWSWPRRCP
ncbi:hypothetical protein ACIA5D_20845 [Actinoplanes sp. NPDC051513]|uniref:hypothetical protein n=1 Tax=Actinoplanes sp. NPDC051513 TaxID=3363908 RepID=UPI00379570D0